MSEQLIVDELVSPDEFLIVEALDDLQHHAGTYFAMPLELVDGEIDEILQAAQLVRGEQITLNWSSMRLTLTPQEEAVPDALVSPEGGQYHIEEERTISVAGRTLRIGRVVTQFTGRLANPDRTRAAYRAGSEMELTLEPVGRGEARRWLKHEESAPNSSVGSREL